MSFWADGFWADGFWADGFWTEAAGVGQTITNANATAGPTNYEICQRTGFRQYPGELMRDGYGELIRPKSVDERHPQDFVRSRGGDRQRGSVSPEQNNSFIVTSIAPEDL